MREQALDLRLALRPALWPSGDFGRVLATLHEAEALATSLDDPRRLGQVSVFLAVDFYLRGAYAQASAAAQRALTLAAASGEVALHALANLFLGRVYEMHGDYHQAIDCLGQTVASLDGARRHEPFGQVSLPAVQARAELARCHAELGTFAEGRAFSEEGLQIAEAVNHPASLIWGYWGIGLLSLRHGELRRALPLLERAIGIYQEADFSVPSFPLVAATLGAAYILGGRLADAIPLLTQAIQQTSATDMRGYQALCCLPLGEAHLLAGHLEEAHALADRALMLAREHQERGHQAYALRLLSEIAVHRDPLDVAQAATYSQQALALAEELGMRPLQAHCYRGLGTLYAKTGQWEQARATLSNAIALYRAMEMTFWLPQAEAALGRVSS